MSAVQVFLPVYDTGAVSAFGNSDGPFCTFHPVGSSFSIRLNLISSGEPRAPSDFQSSSDFLGVNGQM